ncbi:MAG: type 1 glutamine amidotransferase, partial [Gammaproteobacteria bacterium]|nr:type 1 glutamine amidotransferase [Gammaproteobacteria bacterium]
MKIGILLCGRSAPEIVPQFGEYNRQFEKLLDGHGFEFTTYAVVDNQFP